MAKKQAKKKQKTVTKTKKPAMPKKEEIQQKQVPEVTYQALIRNQPVKQFLIDKVGDDGLILVELLFNAKKYVSEFTLAERSSIYVNTVRSLLYKLYENKIVNYIRKREKTRGWYIYSWKFNPEKLAAFLIKKLETETELLKRQISEQSKDEYFYCKECSVKLPFSEAMEYNFSCPNCFKQMELTNPNKENKDVEKRINTLEEETKALKSLKEKLDAMEAKRREEERKRIEREEEERKKLAEKGLYYCTKCLKTHKAKSTKGQEHEEFAK